MKLAKYTETRKQYDAISKRHAYIESRIEALADENNFCGLSMADIKAKRASEHYKANESEIVKLGNESTRTALLRKIYANNMNIDLFEDVTPIIAEVWNKYSGKRYGEQTAKKINAEISALIETPVYIHPYNAFTSNGFNVSVQCGEQCFNRADFCFGYVGNDYDIKILSDNVIQSIDTSKIMLWFVKNERIDVHSVDAIIEAYKAIEEAEKALNNAIENYDSVVPEGVKKLYRVWLTHGRGIADVL